MCKTVHGVSRYHAEKIKKFATESYNVYFKLCEILE